MVKKDTRNLLVLGSIGLAGYFLLRMSGRSSGGGGFIGGGGVTGGGTAPAAPQIEYVPVTNTIRETVTNNIFRSTDTATGVGGRQSIINRIMRPGPLATAALRDRGSGDLLGVPGPGGFVYPVAVNPVAAASLPNFGNDTYSLIESGGYAYTGPGFTRPPTTASRFFGSGGFRSRNLAPVSYTHLTLPTILLV